ncbi:NADPH-dependent FMN reductase [Synechococcus sp. PCC 7336]|uniref:NADPH-dependent FMN reductase n=1 Tax=Synechococcus sp. PCC 7336 TaxID=195250 RepID=UPI00034DA42E|nr:NADPH-dependent FMN reductase [Synechococcus sp. PCC 7336]
MSTIAKTAVPTGTLASNRQRPVKIVGIGGSLRPQSYTYRALHYVAELARSYGAEVEILDLRQMDLPFCQAGDEEGYPDVAKLKQAFLAADGAILATPEYHGGPSGVLKNALDLMSFDQLEGKVFGNISVLGGGSNSNALNQLRTIVRWVHGWTIPEQIAIGQAWQAFDEHGEITDEKLRQRCDRFARSLVENTCKLRGIPYPDAIAAALN